MKWTQVTIATSQEAAEAIANYLFELEASGLEIKDDLSSAQPIVTLVSYFVMDDLVGERLEKLRHYLEQLPHFGLDPQPAQIDLRSVEDENWSEQWRSAFPPQRIGKHLVIAPTWHDVVLQPSEVLIRLDPGMAFGTGHHPTTQLSIELLEKAATDIDTVADLGTGSGILAIIAAKLGAERVDAVDLDSATIPIAHHNTQLNDVASIVHLHAGDGLKALDRKYDLIVANILTKVILTMTSLFPQFLKPSGLLILSGIMVSETKQIETQLRAHHFDIVEKRQRENWVGILAKLSELEKTSPKAPGPVGS